MVAVAPLTAPRRSLAPPAPTTTTTPHRAEDYLGLVRKIAYGIVRRLPSHVDVGDLISIGTLGLLDAIAKYDPRRNENFEAYAELRVRGAIMDGLRRLDWVPRSVRDKSRRLSRTRRALEGSLGRPAESTEVAAELSISVGELHRLESEAQTRTILSMEDLMGASGDQHIGPTTSADDDVLGQLCSQVRTVALAQAIDALSERARLVISLYYFEGLKQKEIGDILGVSESRVCQVMKQAHKALAEALQTADR